MPVPYRPPMEQDEARNRSGFGGGLKQLAAEADRYYIGSDIARDAPQAIPGLYIGQALQDVAKLGYFHGPKPIKKLSQKLSALAFGPDEQFNDQTTSRPSLGQYRGLHEGVKHGFNEKLSTGMIDFMAPRLAKQQNANVEDVRQDLTKARDNGRYDYQLSLTERLQDFAKLTGGDLRQAKRDQASLKEAGLVSPKQMTPSGNIWGLTHPQEAQNLLVKQLKHLNPDAKIQTTVPSNLRLR